MLPTLWTSERRRLGPRSLKTLQGGLGPRGWDFRLMLAASRAARKVFSEKARLMTANAGGFEDFYEFTGWGQKQATWSQDPAAPTRSSVCRFSRSFGGQEGPLTTTKMGRPRSRSMSPVVAGRCHSLSKAAEGAAGGGGPGYAGSPEGGGRRGGRGRWHGCGGYLPRDPSVSRVLSVCLSVCVSVCLSVCLSV